MKLAINQVEERMTSTWGRQAFVVPYRLAGSRTSYAVTDHAEHWVLLLTSWVGGHQVFEPASGPWQERKRDT
jgi:hypothetical protein